MGEVNRPGTYNIPEAQTTVLEVLGLAGDLTIYGNREDILVLRNIDGTMTKELMFEGAELKEALNAIATPIK